MFIEVPSNANYIGKPTKQLFLSSEQDSEKTSCNFSDKITVFGRRGNNVTFYQLRKKQTTA
jgi:hypothetical protein